MKRLFTSFLLVWIVGWTAHWSNPVNCDREGYPDGVNPYMGEKAPVQEDDAVACSEEKTHTGTAGFPSQAEAQKFLDGCPDEPNGWGLYCSPKWVKEPDGE